MRKLAIPRTTKLGLALSLFLTFGTLLSAVFGYALPPAHQAAFESGRWIGFLAGFLGGSDRRRSLRTNGLAQLP